MLDDLPVRVEPEDVDDRRTWLARHADAVHVGDDVLAVGEDPLDLGPEVGEILAEGREERLEAVEAVGDPGVVLHVSAADEAGRRSKSFWLRPIS